MKCYQVDFKNWRKHPWVFVDLCLKLLIRKKASIILSSSAKNIYPMLRVLKILRLKKNIIHWVIGGNLNERILDGAYSCDILNYANFTLVETTKMVDDLYRSGVRNLICVPNFKPITYLPFLSKKNDVPVVRFVFLSRIVAEKGVDYIFESVRALNNKGLKDKYIIDFYGKCGVGYEATFQNQIGEFENVHYRGLLNLQERKGYDILASYHVMLFPTYWKGEGFAGVFIDAFIAGLPIILSDWGHNKAICGEHAYYIPVQDVYALTQMMNKIICKDCDLDRMSQLCRREAEKYDTKNVITKELLYQIKILL